MTTSTIAAMTMQMVTAMAPAWLRRKGYHTVTAAAEAVVVIAETAENTEIIFQIVANYHFPSAMPTGNHGET